MLVARHFRVTGRVQGVGFRYFLEAAARREGLGGWVRNGEDRSLEALVEGDVEAVDRFERALSTGPVGARVEGVTTTEEVPGGRTPMFRILP